MSSSCLSRHIREIRNASVQEYWKYSYPLHQKNTVPSWTVPVIATLVPLAIILVVSLIFRPPAAENHSAILGLFSAVIITALLTNLIKLGVSFLPPYVPSNPLPPTTVPRLWEVLYVAVLCPSLRSSSHISVSRGILMAHQKGGGGLQRRASEDLSSCQFMFVPLFLQVSAASSSVTTSDVVIKVLLQYQII